MRSLDDLMNEIKSGLSNSAPTLGDTSQSMTSSEPINYIDPILNILDEERRLIEKISGIQSHTDSLQKDVDSIDNHTRTIQEDIASIRNKTETLEKQVDVLRAESFKESKKTSTRFLISTIISIVALTVSIIALARS